MTTVVRWNPLREMAALDRMMQNAMRDARPQPVGRHLSLDIVENDEAYTVVTDFPGLDADQINVSLHDGVLTISAAVERAELDENTRVLTQERAYGEFSRSIKLPREVNQDEVAADYNNGTLTLTLPKVPEAKPRQINIHTTAKALPSN